MEVKTMNRVIIPGREDVVVRLMAEALNNIINRPSVVTEASLYRLEDNVSYIATTFSNSIRLKSTETRHPDYWMFNIADSRVKNMNPIRAQIIADEITFLLALTGRFPKGYSPEIAVKSAQVMYEVAYYKHPNKELRPTFLLLSFNFPIWARVLPDFSKEMSLSI